MTDLDDEIEPAKNAATAGGTYTLLLSLEEPSTNEIGALGKYRSDRGFCAYTGSALGLGGFARIYRHREIASGERSVRHWHVDYLLGDPGIAIDAVWISPGADRECAIAGSLPGEPVPDFGASDCDCEAHLVAADGRSRLGDALAERHDRRHPDLGE